MRRIRAYIGLGSNVGRPVETLTAAVQALVDLRGVRVVGVSGLYATRPVGVVDQPEFRNAVIAVDVPGGPDPTTAALSLLAALKDIERAFGRRRRRRWGPRELDLDLLVFGRHRIDVERPPEGSSLDPAAVGRTLEVPHPEAHDRLFVLDPLADLAPGLVPPGWGESVRRARSRALEAEGSTAARLIGRWDAATRRWSGAQEAGG